MSGPSATPPPASPRTRRQRPLLWLLWLLPLLALGGLGVWWLLGRIEPGVVWVEFGGWRVETSLWWALALVWLALTFASLLLRLLWWPGHLRRWRRRRAERQFQQGVQALSRGEHQQAERRLRASARLQGDTAEAWPARWLAAQAALASAHQATRVTETGVAALDALPERLASLLGADEAGARPEQRLALAELLLPLDTEQAAMALAAFTERPRQAPPRARALLWELCLRRQDWQSAVALWPDLKADLESHEHIRRGRTAWLGLIEQRLREEGLEAGLAVWADMPATLQQREDMLLPLCSLLVQIAPQGGAARAANLLAQQLGRRWSEALFDAWARLPHRDAAGALQRAETWLKRHAPSPAQGALAWQAVAQLAAAAGRLGRAREALEQVMVCAATPEQRRQAQLQLAEIFLRMDEPERALAAYRAALPASLPAPIDTSAP